VNIRSTIPTKKFRGLWHILEKNTENNNRLNPSRSYSIRTALNIAKIPQPPQNVCFMGFCKQTPEEQELIGCILCDVRTYFIYSVHKKKKLHTFTRQAWYYNVTLRRVRVTIVVIEKQ